jgi:Ni/Co efflux regulator RcnB
MKHFLTAAIALSLVGGSAAMAQPHQYDRHDERAERHDDRNDRGANHDNGQHRGQYKKWARGQRLSTEYRTRGHYVDYRSHHLRAPPRGYQWVQVDNNYMMVALTSGLIASIVAGR